ncbi:unnamed protein product, partial [Didymodactylos carnosus]
MAPKRKRKLTNTLSSFTLSAELVERWANLMAMKDEELIPVDIIGRQMLFDASATVDGSGE